MSASFLRPNVQCISGKKPTKIVKGRKTMTKEQILEKLKFDLESRGRSEATVKEYTEKIRLFQDYYGKPKHVLLLIYFVEISLSLYY